MALGPLPPLVSETLDDIRARMNADANAGLSPTDPRWLDTAEGGFFWDLTQVAALEAERLWDFLGRELPSALFVSTSWGIYLDYAGETVGVARKASVKATGYVDLVGTVGTVVGSGTQFAGEAATTASDPPVFQSTKDVVLAQTPGPVNFQSSITGSGGTLPAGTYYYAVSAIVVDGDTVVSEEAAATAVGTTSKVDLAWDAYSGALGYKVYRGVESGDLRLLATLGITQTYSDDGSATPSTTEPPSNRIPVEAVTAGSDGNAEAGTVQILLSPNDGIQSVYNPDAISGGSEVESDDDYRARLELEYTGVFGGGTVDDYRRWALAEPGVGNVTVVPIWSGPGTVRVVITDADNNPVSAAIVASLQDKLDPTAGKGEGLAPIGATVTVETPSTVTVTVSATLTLSESYSIDGTGGTVAVRDSIELALANYVNKLAPGDDVIIGRVEAAIFSVEGVYDVSNVQVNSGSSNVAIGSSQVANLGTVTLA